MKFCYIDETGAGNEPVAIAVGILVDPLRMHRTKLEWNVLLTQLSTASARPITELHTRDLYSGNSAWRGVAAADRIKAIRNIIEWFNERKHKVTFSAINKQAFETRKTACPISQELGDPITAVYLHVILSAQKVHQSQAKNKGHTVVILDKGKDEKALTKLIFEPPPWTDTYYSRKKKSEALDQIVDTPFFADSAQVPLIQVADLIAFLLRRYSELEDFGDEERYEGERKRLSEWIQELQKSFLPSANRYPKTGRCNISKVYFELAPRSLRVL